MNEKTANKLTVILFLITGLISLNISKTSLVSNILGAAFLIAAVYGLVCVLKNQKFLF